MSTTTINGKEEESKEAEQQPKTAEQQKLVKPVLVSTSFDGTPFQISKKYKLLKVIGKGAYGIVMSALDTESNEKVAIKKILNVFEQDREYQKRIFREVKILRHFDDHENIINLRDLVPPSNFENFRDVYIVSDLMDSDMRAIIKSPQELTDQNIQYFLYQILRGLKYVHSANILHRDLKPSNILLNEDMDVKICDFGLSRGVDFENNPTMSTPYVATRWYRAPELLLMWEKASKALDIWSVGCIFAELLDKPKRKVLFPGKNYLNQLELILNVCGTPPQDDIKGCAKAKRYLSSLPIKPKKDFGKIYPHASSQAIDLLSKMLHFDPEKRITVEEALAHPYLTSMHDPEDEATCKNNFDFEFNDEIETKQIKQMLYDEIMDWNRTRNGVGGDAIIVEDDQQKNE